MTVVNNRWLIDEDEALKTKLQGLTVTNYVDGRKLPVAVYFRFPDTEERNRTYPHVAIDLIDIQFDRTRAHRANSFTLNYDMEQATPISGYDLVAYDLPLPWTLVYQLSTFARQPWHDRQLQAMMFQLFPQTFGWLDMTSWDGTIRRADLQGVVRRDMIDTDRKRLYRLIYTIGVSSEFLYADIVTIQQVTSAKLTLNAFRTQIPSTTSTPDFTENVIFT